MPQWTCYIERMRTQDQIRHYALESDAALIFEFQRNCEALADLITKQIALMERCYCEDGNIDWPERRLHYAIYRVLLSQPRSINGIDPPEVTKQLSIEIGLVFDEFKKELNFEYTLSKEYAKKQGKRQQVILCLEKIIEESATLPNNWLECNKITSEYLWNLYHPIINELKPWFVCELPTTIPTTAEFKQIRRVLWDASAEVIQYARFAESEILDREHKVPEGPGRRINWPTKHLVAWASFEPVAFDALARMLVEADIDRNQSGTAAARIRRETKRLRAYLSNNQKKSSAASSPVGI